MGHMVVDRFPARPWRCGYLIVGAVALLLGPTPAVSSAAEPDELETAEAAVPVAEESGFWTTNGARDFDWGD